MSIVFIMLGVSWLLSLAFVFMLGHSAGAASVVKQFAGTVERITNGLSGLMNKMGQKQ